VPAMQPSPAAPAAAASGLSLQADAPDPTSQAGTSGRRMPGTAGAPGMEPRAESAGQPRVVLVTGAARRLGRAIALALAHDGWDVGVHYLRSEQEAGETAEEVRAIGRRAVCLKADLEDEPATRSLVRQLAERLGPVRGLVNNASRFIHDDLESVDAASLLAHLVPNLVAPLLLSQALFHDLPEASNADEGSRLCDGDGDGDGDGDARPRGGAGTRDGGFIGRARTAGRARRASPGATSAGRGCTGPRDRCAPCRAGARSSPVP